MEFSLSHFVLHAPSAGLAYWFVSHDFAEPLGFEYSRDAVRELKQLVGHLGARVDYEADAVILRIRRNESVVPTLRAIYVRLQWDAAELQRLEPAILAYRRPRAKEITAGDVFLIPIGNDLYGLGQVLDVQYKAPTVAVFRFVGSRAEVEAKDPKSLPL